MGAPTVQAQGCEGARQAAAGQLPVWKTVFCAECHKGGRHNDCRSIPVQHEEPSESLPPLLARLCPENGFRGDHLCPWVTSCHLSPSLQVQTSQAGEASEDSSPQFACSLIQFIPHPSQE